MIVTDVGHGMRWTRQRWARTKIAGRVDEARERSDGAQTNGANAYGKAVWSWHPLLMLNWRRLSRPNRV
jgi:NO-binding membrane sensor protein with MHYT domain